METNNLGLRKGMWTPEEDILLRKCIEAYGEGKWHLVPLRAGLKRCRKSCRLRWLNYLKPNIKRGQFSNDEVDLIVRLHKLLGNRWSLIAGRLPGRTANDVKNFWNSHMEKKVATLTGRVRAQKSITRSNIARPRPRTFSALRPEAVLVTGEPDASNDADARPPPLCHDADECTRWWSSLLEMATDNKQRDADHVEGFTDFSSIDDDIWNFLSFGDEC